MNSNANCPDFFNTDSLISKKTIILESCFDLQCRLDRLPDVITSCFRLLLHTHTYVHFHMHPHSLWSFPRSTITPPDNLSHLHLLHLLHLNLSSNLFQTFPTTLWLIPALVTVDLSSNSQWSEWKWWQKIQKNNNDDLLQFVMENNLYSYTINNSY